MMGIDWADWLSWMYSGVDNSLAGNGGAKCAAFIPSYQKMAETLLMVSIGVFEMYITYPHLTVLPMPGSYSQRSNRTSKRVLLVVLCVTFGIELGFKFATRQMIWILNPCHIVTVLQVCIINWLAGCIDTWNLLILAFWHLCRLSLNAWLSVHVLYWQFSQVFSLFYLTRPTGN